MITDKKQLTEGVLRILSPLRGIWEDAGWLMNAIEEGLIPEDSLRELANLLVRATDTVDRNERILVFSQASGFARQNRAEEYAERMQEQKEGKDSICNFV